MNNLLRNYPDHKQIFRRNFTVRYSEVNKFGIIKLQSVFDYLQQTAAEHANALGCGMHNLYKLGMMWVLSKMSVRIYGSFRPEQKITICTYPSGVERLFFRREFEISDAETNEVLLHSSSYWLLLDAEKLRPLRRDVLKDKALENPDLPIFIPEFPAAPDFNDMQIISSTPVRFSQMDINQHLNNSQYAALTEDAIFEKMQSEFTVKEINVSFLQAQKYPDVITNTIEIKESGDFNLISSNAEKNCTVFTAYGKLQ